MRAEGQFVVDVPDDAKVGDRVFVSGWLTINKVEADLVDITQLGDRKPPRFALGEFKASGLADLDAEDRSVRGRTL